MKTRRTTLDDVFETMNDDLFFDIEDLDTPPKKMTKGQIFKELEEYDIEDIEDFLRTKKLNRIKNKIK
jgi:hypothetical protein